MSVENSDGVEALYQEAAALAKRAPAPARVGNVVFGTAGWTDPSLIRSHAFYPRGSSKPRARLEYYASQFPMVEVDATYYAVLAPSTSERWASWVPADFRFNVKVHASMTGHPVDVGRLPAPLKERLQRRLGDVTRLPADALDDDWTVALESAFEAFLSPLVTAERMGALLFQFPPWVRATRGNARRLEAIRERWPERELAIEFRHASWLAPERVERVASLLSDLRMSYVAVDEPSLSGRGVPATLLVPNPSLAVVRLHGQNASGWVRGASVAQRFDYLYAADELRGWVPRVRRLADKAERVQVVFNNCVRDFAVLNAKGLAALLPPADALAP